MSSYVPGYNCTNVTSGCVDTPPSTRTFSVPASANLTSVNMTDPFQVGLAVLWDTGAYGVFHVDSYTYNAYYAGFQVRLLPRWRQRAYVRVWTTYRGRAASPPPAPHGSRLLFGALGGARPPACAGVCMWPRRA